VKGEEREEERRGKEESEEADEFKEFGEAIRNMLSHTTLIEVWSPEPYLAGPSLSPHEPLSRQQPPAIEPTNYHPPCH
jgi:hypothetical protein